MDSMLLGALSAFWFGILTSISPCPLATNIAAISYIGKHVESNRKVMLSGIFYTLGRMISYIGISLIIIAGLLSIPHVSFFLQEHMNKLLGPILLIAGLFLLEVIHFSLPDVLPKEKFSSLAENGNVLSAGLLGIIFALSFCPVSAALFFGSLIPISIKHNSVFLFPSLYGIGTSLPVFVFASIMGISTQFVGKAFNKITQFEFWARRITGVIFIAVGIYYSLIYLFKISL
jgi:cytochrome c-type biogenesis protein